MRNLLALALAVLTACHPGELTIEMPEPAEKPVHLHANESSSEATADTGWVEDDSGNEDTASVETGVMVKTGDTALVETGASGLALDTGDTGLIETADTGNGVVVYPVETADTALVETADTSLEIETADTGILIETADTGMVETGDTGFYDSSFEIIVDVYNWTGNTEGWNVCDFGPCLDYSHAATVAYGEAATVLQRQSWPVYVSWQSEVPVTLTALGFTSAAASGEAYFNPWQNLDLEFCAGGDCVSVVSLEVVGSAVRYDCTGQTIDGFYQSSPSWTDSNGEAYGVSSMDSATCSHYSCTGWAPPWACPATDQPHADCAAYGCECNLNAWSNIGPTEVRYDASVTAAAGVSAPWFADRWESGGLHAESGDSVVFRMYTEVSLSEDNMIMRPVMDMRTNWSGLFSEIPNPDGFEGPPVFRNAANDAIAPADGFWPVEWEVAPTGETDVWMQPLWNVIVRPDAESGTADFRNLAFTACGADVDEIHVNVNGHYY